MLQTNQIRDLFKHFFGSSSYGQSLEKFILSHNPKNSADVERLEHQWNRRNNFYTRSDWL